MKKDNTIFNTLWARVSETLNKVGPVAWDRQLSQIIVDNKAAITAYYPFKKLPNVREFTIKWLHPYDPTLEDHGIKRRLATAEFESKPYKNKSMNRYVTYQFRRLNNCTSHPSKFWAIATHLLFRSHSYRTICFNHVYPQWHRKYKYSVVKNILESLRKIDLDRYDHKIKLIPKPNGEMRPLGIPSPAWRVLLHGLNNILLVWFSAYLHPSQHGFIPGRGTLTAWQDISTKLTSSHIYEFDLRKFFDTVNLSYLSKLLKITGIPIHIADTIIKWNQTLPRRSPRHGITWANPLDEAQDYKYHKTGVNLIGHTDYTYWINRKRQDEYLDPTITPYEYYRGVSQGMPTSPLLSTILLAPHLHLNSTESIVLYADDGIIFSNHAIIPPVFPKQTGISLNSSKSSHVKINDVWQHALKFLGLTYTYSPDSPSDTLIHSGTLRNSTRIPKSFTLSKLDAFREAGYYVNYSGNVDTTFDHWLKTKIAGYLHSRLYLGNYEDNDVLQDFSYNYESRSWAHLECRRRPSVSSPATYRINSDKDVPAFTIFNSSSFANQSLSR
jgi:hypothetical protein